MIHLNFYIGVRLPVGVFQIVRSVGWIFGLICDAGLASVIDLRNLVTIILVGGAIVPSLRNSYRLESELE